MSLKGTGIKTKIKKNIKNRKIYEIKTNEILSRIFNKNRIKIYYLKFADLREKKAGERRRKHLFL